MISIKQISNKVIQAACAFSVACAFSSCEDFLTIYPTDRTVGEDFWKTKADVEEMVNGCYQSMLSYSIQERAIIWGAFRSDELVKYKDYSSTTLDNISAVNLLPNNGFNDWSSFYYVINHCNIVLNHAPEVMAQDPEFTQGDYQTVRAQMLALRSLCYFYLVRTFRDIPYSLQSYEDDDQNMALPQNAPAYVLEKCLEDLAEAERYIMKSGAYGTGNWRNWGYMTRDAVNALTADIYLWRASMTHNMNDYQEAVNYADKVIKAKHEYYNQQHQGGISAATDDIYHLSNYPQAFISIFSEGNEQESILEWQFNGRNNANQALGNYYYRSGDPDNPKTTSNLMASTIFSTPSSTANNADAKKIYLSKNDYRFWNNVYDANNDEAEQLSIRKMIDKNGLVISTSSTSGATKSTSRQLKEFAQNWIVYRLPDVMLMKAEALVELAGDDNEEMLKEAFDLVYAVNKRAMSKDATDLLNFNDFKTKTDMELLVLAERERELCFEGKRWWDLMRYSYRHMQGVDITKTLAETSSWPELYKPMLKFIVRKYGEGGQGDAISYKMKSEPYLYWPVLESEMKVNPLLKQNPVFEQEKSTVKN